MSRARRAVYLFLALVMGAVVVPAPSQATQQVECTTAVSSRVCSSVVKVGDPEKPCIEHEGKAYCPVFNTYYPKQQA